MKKLLAALALIAMLSLASCNKEEVSTDETVTPEVSSEEVTPEVTPEVAPEVTPEAAE